MNKKIKENKNNIISFIIGILITLIIVDIHDIVKKKPNDVISGNSKSNNIIYEKSSLAPAIEKIYDAVVVVKNKDTSNTGSGFIYKTDDKYAYIFTNQHILSDQRETIIVLSNGKTVTAKILGEDKYIDLAVLRISKEEVNLVATIGNSESIKLGDTVFTVGAPSGEDYQGSVTAGILSGKDRMVKTLADSKDWVMKVLQIDAPINPGNSGGPVLNANGEVIGICIMKIVEDDIEGMGFAIPIEDAISNIENLENGKEIKRPELGIKMANEIDLEGVKIIEIEEDSSAYNSDLKKDDIITEINNKRIKDTAYLKYELYKYQVGDTIEITYIRDKKEKKTKIKIKSSN